MGFGVWFFALEIDYGEEQRTITLEKILKGIKKKKKRHSINLFCFNVFIKLMFIYFKISDLDFVLIFY